MLNGKHGPDGPGATGSKVMPVSQSDTSAACGHFYLDFQSKEWFLNSKLYIPVSSIFV